jgi:hypothetical protein
MASILKYVKEARVEKTLRVLGEYRIERKFTTGKDVYDASGTLVDEYFLKTLLWIALYPQEEEALFLIIEEVSRLLFLNLS